MLNICCGMTVKRVEIMAACVRKVDTVQTMIGESDTQW